MRDYFIVFGIILGLAAFVTFVLPNLGDGYGERPKESADKNRRN